jgi:hypothetical protein
VTNLRKCALLISLLSLVSCLEKTESRDSSSSTSSWFSGIVSATNLGGNPASIRLNWNASTSPVTAYRVYALTYDADTRRNSWSLVEEVNSNTTSYIHSDLEIGKIYTYMVRAVDNTGTEDTNTAQKSSVSFDGIADVNITGTDSALVSISSPTGAFDEIRIYAQPSRTGGRKVLVARAAGGATDIPVTGLRSGVKYKFSAVAYMNYLNAEDGNDVFIEKQTYSKSFGSGIATDTSYLYRGMLSVQAFGDAPNAPAAPTAKLVRLTWPAFSGATSTTAYRVIRASSNYSSTTLKLDMTTTTPCADPSTGVPATESACIVNCTNTGSGVQTCEDSYLGNPPITYNYAVALLRTDSATTETWVEELPQTNFADFYTAVQVPSRYMVLVQRDAANYEMCQLLGSASNPRKHQRCLYSGIGATPYNSGPGKPALSFDAGYYDFGYNLLVDRFQLACNWTRNDAACGPLGCAGVVSTNSAGVPTAAAANNAVYWGLTGSYGSNCFVKTTAGWKAIATTATLTAAQLAAATTIDPGPANDRHNPVIDLMIPDMASAACSAQTSDYGTKRLLRRREAIHAEAFATLPGEPGAITDAVQRARLLQGLDGYTQNQCAYTGSLSDSRLAPVPTTFDASATGILNAANTRSAMNFNVTDWFNIEGATYFIGTDSTSKCVSRWGSQDIISRGSRNAPWLADMFVRSNSTSSYPIQLTPAPSDYDAGVVFEWGSFQFNGVMGPNWCSSSAPYSGCSSTSYDVGLSLSNALLPYVNNFVYSLGVPYVAVNSVYNTFSQAVASGALGAADYGVGSNARTRLNDSGGTRYQMNMGGTHRFSYSIFQGGAGSTQNTGTAWCAVEAE